MLNTLGFLISNTPITLLSIISFLYNILLSYLHYQLCGNYNSIIPNQTQEIYSLKIKAKHPEVPTSPFFFSSFLEYTNDFLPMAEPLFVLQIWELHVIANYS